MNFIQAKEYTAPSRVGPAKKYPRLRVSLGPRSLAVGVLLCFNGFDEGRAMQQVGILGGTGPEGKGLALRLAKAGIDVTIGSRSSERAGQAAAELSAMLSHSAGRLTGVDNEKAAAAGVAFLTVPFEHAASLLDSLRGSFSPGTLLVDVTVPLLFESGKVTVRRLSEGSGSEHLKAHLPGHVDIVGAFKTIPAHLLEKPEEPLDCDVFICGDSAEAKKRLVEVVSLIDGLRPLDAGPLSQAFTLECMSALAIGLNRRYRVKFARYRIVGL
jgi:8-hydroxy-5-deazaflavin:NADPH oxidoreductase